MKSRRPTKSGEENPCPRAGADSRIQIVLEHCCKRRVPGDGHDVRHGCTDSMRGGDAAAAQGLATEGAAWGRGASSEACGPRDGAAQWRGRGEHGTPGRALDGGPEAKDRVVGAAAGECDNARRDDAPVVTFEHAKFDANGVVGEGDVCAADCAN